MTDVRRWIAPGRINLIGEHLDHNGGPVLPMAIDRQIRLKARLRDDDLVRVWTTLGGQQRAEFSLPTRPGSVSGWAAYVAGVFWALTEAGHPTRGADLVLDGDLPAGAGLSSSAAVEVVVAAALNDLLGLGLEPEVIASVAHRAENEYVGVPCGVMDQLAVALGVQGSALLIDTGQEPATVESIDVDWASAGLALVAIDTGSRRELTDGRYAERREECRRAAEELGLDQLCSAGPDAVLKITDETLKARTRHVITETARVRGAARALRSGNWTQLGAMLTASHVSLKDDFAVSQMELDIAAETALAGGALGARMTGAGFGGSVIALIDQAKIPDLADRIAARFAHHELAAPVVFVLNPSAGAREV